MGWNDGDSPGKLGALLVEGRTAEAEALVTALLESLDPERGQPRRVGKAIAEDVLSTLRGFARFDRMLAVGRRLVECGQDDPVIRRQVAQARIETGDLTGAIEDLLALREELEQRRSESAASATELGETLGLLGRSYKQLYVNASPRVVEPRIEDLNRALEHYGRAYRERIGDFLWHGVNYIGLLTRAERVSKGASVYSEKAQAHAEEILKLIEKKERQSGGSLEPWDAANRAEALLALGRNPEAVEAVKAYLETPGMDAFKVQSTRRQFEELWLLNEATYPGKQILPMMVARFAELGGGGAGVNLSRIEAGGLEAVWGETGYKPLRWLLEAVERAGSVARLGRNRLVGIGTGFLIDGAWIDDRWRDRPLLLTNSHVCTSDTEIQRQHRGLRDHRSYKAVFMAARGAGTNPPEIELIEELFTSPPSELDATLLAIGDPPEGVKAPPRAERIPSFSEWTEKRVNIIGHPRSLDTHVSLQDNVLVGIDDRYLHYRTPTDPGSSGSPIFDQDWKLVGIHHSAEPSLKANEGIRLDRILEAVRRQHFA